MSKNFNSLVGLFILLTYSVTFGETYTNSNIDSTDTQMLLPSLNVSNLLILLCGLVIMLPNKSRVKISVLTVSFYISFALLVNMFDVLMFYSQMNYSYERYFWILFMNSVTFAYLVHAFCSGIITINPKTFILSNLLLIFAYMLSYRVFMNTGFSIFGVGTKYYDFFFFEHTLILESKFIHILIYSILSLGFVVIKKLVKNMKHSNNFTNDIDIK